MTGPLLSRKYPICQYLPCVSQQEVFSIAKTFHVIEVDEARAEVWEPVGKKQKFWFADPTLGRCLFKYSRQATGEHWSEKIACELCSLLNLPHAHYELAVSRRGRGNVSVSFCDQSSELILGNEYLSQFCSDYDTEATYRHSKHTLNLVFTALSHLEPPKDCVLPAGITTASDVFVGYLLLDAWIGNTDRHHLNWGCVRHSVAHPTQKVTLHLAPTFDHASSLGRELQDEQRKLKLNTHDIRGTVSVYAKRCRSAFYDKETNKSPMTSLEAFTQAAQVLPDAAETWMVQLEKISCNDTLRLFEQIPDDLISPEAIQFAQELLDINRQRLLKKGI
ncbi:MAG: HipA-like protein [Candidatus Melainabacteria bacterium]|nr:HipA-like protein [Candidatus Melainabacteria bacterium]